MGKDKVSYEDRSPRGSAAERKLRDAALMGSEQPAAADHGDYENVLDPDTDLHLDGEEDTLYSDGLDIQEDSETLSGTRGISPASIKP